MRISFLIAITALFFTACGDSASDSGRKTYSDLPFEKANDAKTYSDLIIHSIRTNRDKPIAQEFTDNKNVDEFQLRRLVGMYSTGITGRSDWEEFDIHELSKKKDFTAGFDYAWLEPKGRLGMQIYVKPVKGENGRFTIEKLEFRSRIDVMESHSFPGGPIENYKKLDFNW